MLKRAFPTLLNAPQGQRPEIVVDPEFLMHLQNLGLILAHSRSPNEVVWKLDLYKEVIKEPLETEPCTD